MKVNWFSTPDLTRGKVILVGDVGGTNSNLGIALAVGSQISLVLETVFSSHEVENFLALVERTLGAAKEKYPQLKLDLCCISAAGPVKDNVCVMTNQDWAVDGRQVEKAVGVPTIIINDFTAISFGIPLLQVQNPDQVLPLHRPGGRHPAAQGDLMAVVGAGTGLGVGFISRIGEKYRAFPSEGGHMDFAGTDPDTKAFQSWIQDKIDLAPEYEMAISGMGIKNLFYFFLERGDLAKDDPVVKEVLEMPDIHKPQGISGHSLKHPGMKKIMETFVRMYAKFAASVACLLLPTAGLYLAGGISGKNLEHFLHNDLFVREFENHCNPNLVGVLESIPLYIIKDYSISLAGAANAALSLMV